MILLSSPQVFSLLSTVYSSAISACCAVSAANKRFSYAIGQKQGQCSIHTVHSGQTNWQTDRHADRHADRQHDTLAVRRSAVTKTQSLCFSLATILCAAIGSS